MNSMCHSIANHKIERQSKAIETQKRPESEYRMCLPTKMKRLHIDLITD